MRTRQRHGPFCFAGRLLCGWALLALVALLPEGVGAAREKVMTDPPLFARQLSPAYERWLDQPGELRGFWAAFPPGEVRERTGASAFSVHYGLRLAADATPGKDPAIKHDFEPPRSCVRMGWSTTRTMAVVSVLVSTAYEGAAGRVRLERIAADGQRILVETREQANARVDSWVVLRPKDPAPAGAYELTVEPVRKRVDVWPTASHVSGAWLEDPAGNAADSKGQPGRRAGWALAGWVQFTDGTWIDFGPTDSGNPCVSVGKYGLADEARELGLGLGVDLGEHNNPFFIYYPESFRRDHPEAFMLDATGRPIGVGSGDNPIRDHSFNPVPAVDDPLLNRLSRRLITTGVNDDRDAPAVRYWVIGGEESYPDLFGLPAGDFRPAFLDHFKAWCTERRWDLPTDLKSIQDERSATRAAWLQFREAALAERAAVYTQTFLAGDASRPILYPTHGNPFFSYVRRTMGHPPSLLAGACDGIETGQITIDGDDERLNVLTLAHLTAYGSPVVTPRLANKTLNPGVPGGGTSFTPAMLRRLVYECLGLGIGHVGLVQWAGNLGDGQWQIKGTPAEAEAKRVFGEIEAAGPWLAGMERLAPAVGLYVSDQTWLQVGWQARWTGFFQDALADHWNLGLVGDDLLGARLAERMPVLITLDNPVVSRRAMAGLADYLAAGGRLVQWGEWAERDELGRPHDGWPAIARMAGERAVPCAAPPAAGERTLRNMASTGSGAHVETRTYQPAPFAALAEAAGRWPGARLAHPVELSAPATVNVFYLTDGTTLLTVLINNADAPAEVRLGAPRLPVPGQGAPEWRFRPLEAAPGGDRRDDPRGGCPVKLDARGTALVWIYPDGLEAAATLAQAEKTLVSWAGLGVDVEPFQLALAQARRAAQAGEAPKAAALARRVTESLGVAVTTRPLAEGALEIAVTLYAPDGQPASAGQAWVRWVPGPFQWQSLSPDGPGNPGGPGRLRATVTRAQRPRWFDMEARAYQPLAGPARLVIEAGDGRHRGGALVNLKLD